MTITIEGYSVVVKKSCIVDLLEDGTIQPPNRNHIADDHIWRCGFMAESDAQQFVEDLETAGLNGSQGPDPDVVIVNEFLQEVVPYCEWLELAQWEKAVLAWKTGTDPQTLVALEGFDPKVGSGLNFYDQSTMNDLEFLRVEDNIEVYFNKKLGREVYLGRTTKPVEATFESATATIRAHMRTAGEPALKGEDFQQVSYAV